MPTYIPQQPASSLHSSLWRNCRREMMKKEHHAVDTSIYDFDEQDPKPYGGKESKKSFFQAAFVSKGTRPAKQPKVTGKGLNKNSSRKRGSLWKMSTKELCQQNATAEEARGNWSSSGSDKIETDNSDSDVDRDMSRQSRLRTRGAYGPLCGSFEACKDEEFVAEKDREVTIIGELLLLSGDIHIPSPEFTFTADTIVLKIRDANLECIIKWPLHEIESFRSCADQEAGSAFIELDLTESGVEALEEKLPFDTDYSCHTISSSISNVGIFWHEQERQITSLSDGYKSKWRPGKQEMIEQFQKRIHWGRQDLDNFEEKCLSVDRMVQERHRASLDDWFDIVFPKEDHDAVTVTKYDYLLLNPDEFVSDTIIDFYIKFLQSKLPENEKERFYFFNSFFFRKLTEVDKIFQHGFEKCKSSFERVKRWTAKVNIFDKDYLFIPIMQSAHWSLVIICHPGYLSAECQDACDSKAPIILHFDSLEGCHTGLEEPIRNYLVEAWSQKNGCFEDSGRISAVKFVAAKVPQQTNYSDCGLFLLHYVELFIKELLDGDSTDFVTGEWFNPADASKKRAEIQLVIKCLQDKELAGRGKNPQHYLASNVMVSTDGALLAQRSAELGDEDPSFVFKEVTNNLDLVHGNLSDQADSTFDRHLLHHESQMHVNAYACLEQDSSEAGLDFMDSAFPSQLHHSLQGCRSQQEAVNDSPDYSLVVKAANSLPEYTLVEENSMDQHAHEKEAANDLPYHTNLEENSMDYHANGREAANYFPYYIVEEGANDFLDSTMAEEGSNILKSESLVNINPGVDGKIEPGFAYYHYTDVGNNAMQSLSDEMWSESGDDKFNQSHNDCKQAMDKERESSVEQVVETAESSFLLEKVNTQFTKGTVKASAGSSELKQCLVGSIGTANDLLEDKDMDSEGVETLHNKDDICWVIDVECIASVVADDQSKDEVAIVMECGKGESLQDEDDTCKAIIMEGAVPSLRELLECKNPCRIPDTSPPRKGDTSGLAKSHYISSDEEPSTPYYTKVDKARKAGRPSRRKNAREDSELCQAHVGRPLTRSASKRTEDKPKGSCSYLLRRKK